MAYRKQMDHNKNYLGISGKKHYSVILSMVRFFQLSV